MSSSLLNITGVGGAQLHPRKAEIVWFETIKEADYVAEQIRQIIMPEHRAEVLTFAAGMYYVVLIHPDLVEATDGTTSTS